MNPTAQLLEPEIRELIRDGLYSELREALHLIPPADVAEILSELPAEQAALGFRFMPRDDAAMAFSYLDADKQQQLISALGAEASVRVVEAMEADDRVKLIDEMPDEVAQRLIGSLSPETRRETQAILGYPPRSVGRLMTPDYVRIKPEWTISQAIDNIRKYGRDAETVNVVYVVDDQGKLVDDVRLRQLLFANPEDTVESIMNRQFVSLRADQDQAEAVQLLQRYDRVALPVIDSRGVLLGIVTHDDVADVAQALATEEMQKLGGLEALDEPYMNTPLTSLVRKRVIWLAVLFVGEMFTASVLGYFEHQLERTVVLSLFIPLIVSSGGNSGSQASSLIIRALALREIQLSDWWRVLRRELACGFLLGAMLGVLGLIRIHVWHLAGLGNYTAYYHLVAIAIMCAVLGIVLWGCIVGAMFPFILKKIRLDPATSSAPFVATLVDVTGIAIYLSVAMLILRGTLLQPSKFEEAPLPAGTADAYVDSVTADPQGQPYFEIIVQTTEQKAAGMATRLRVPTDGLPDGRPPSPGDHIRINLAADKATGLKILN